MANAKKAVKKVNKSSYSNDNEISKLIKLVIIVCIIVLAFYIVTYFINKTEKVETPDVPAYIQYDEILIGNMLKQPVEEYYVMIFDSDDYDSQVYSTYLGVYERKEDAIRIYTSELNNPMNQKFKSDESNFDIDDIKDIKISGATLFKIRDGEIEEVYEGEELKNYLKEISKEEEEAE